MTSTLVADYDLASLDARIKAWRAEWRAGPDNTDPHIQADLDAADIQADLDAAAYEDATEPRDVRCVW